MKRTKRTSYPRRRSIGSHLIRAESQVGSTTISVEFYVKAKDVIEANNKAYDVIGRIDGKYVNVHSIIGGSHRYRQPWFPPKRRKGRTAKKIAKQ